MDELSLMNPIIIGVGIGMSCVCCIICIGCIYCQCSRSGKTSNNSTSVVPPPSSRPHARSNSDLAAIQTMKHNQELVRSWLRHELSLDQYYSLFIENGYGSMRAVKSIRNKQELIDIGITKRGHQTLIMSNIQLMQRAEQSHQKNKAQAHKKKEVKSPVIDQRKAFNESLVAEWLEHSCNLLQYFPLFIKNGYDSMNIIKRIKDPSQLRDIGIKKHGHVLLILSEIQNLQNRRKTIDQHVDEVYIKIHKKNVANHKNIPQKYPPPNPNEQNRQNMMRNQQYAMNRPPPQQIQQIREHYVIEDGPGANGITSPSLPNLPDALGETPPGHDIDDLFGTMQSTTAGTQSTTFGMGAITQEVIDGQFYNVTKGTDGGITKGFVNPNRINPYSNANTGNVGAY